MILKALLILRLTVTLILVYVSNDGDGDPLEAQKEREVVEILLVAYEKYDTFRMSELNWVRA